MSEHSKVDVSVFVPGGIKPTDRWHCGTNDNTCSRCSAEIADDEVPLLLWSRDGHDLLIYCNRCIDG